MNSFEREQLRQKDRDNELLGQILRSVAARPSEVQIVTTYYFEEAFDLPRFSEKFQRTVDAFASRHNLLCIEAQDRYEYYLISRNRSITELMKIREEREKHRRAAVQ